MYCNVQVSWFRQRALLPMVCKQKNSFFLIPSINKKMWVGWVEWRCDRLYLKSRKVFCGEDQALIVRSGKIFIGVFQLSFQGLYSCLSAIQYLFRLKLLRCHEQCYFSINVFNWTRSVFKSQFLVISFRSWPYCGCSVSSDDFICYLLILLFC